MRNSGRGREWRPLGATADVVNSAHSAARLNSIDVEVVTAVAGEGVLSALGAPTVVRLTDALLNAVSGVLTDTDTAPVLEPILLLLLLLLSLLLLLLLPDTLPPPPTTDTAHNRPIAKKSLATKSA